MLYRDYLKSKYQNTAVKLANAEGVPCVLEYSKGKNMRNYEVYGNSVQDGTPTPESPVEIQSVGDLTTKNLIDYTTVSTRSGTTAAFIDNGFVYTGNYYFSFDGSFLEIGNTYVMSWNFEGDDTLTPTWRLAYEDGTYSSIVRNGVSLKIAQSVSKILVYPEMSKTTYTTTFTNIQLEEGSTATEYEPYHKYDIPITVTGTRSETTHIYLDEPLRKVGDYADYIDFKNQKVVRKVKELTLDGTETWYKGTTMADTIAFYIKPNNILNLSNQYSILSDKFIIKSSGVSSIDNEFAQNTGINVYFKINKSRLNSETIDEMKAWVTANNIQLYYILAIPTEETISLPALKTFKGTNIMTVDTAVLPSNIKAKYIRT